MATQTIDFKRLNAMPSSGLVTGTLYFITSTGMINVATGATTYKTFGPVITRHLTSGKKIASIKMGDTTHDLYCEQNTWRDITDSTSTTSSTVSASATAVKSAYDKATSAYSLAEGKTSNKGTVTSVTVQGSNGLSGSGTVTSSGTITIIGADASTSAKGVVQLSSAVNSTSETVAATSKAVKTAYDQAVSAYNLANGKTTYSLPLSANGTRGGIQIGYSASGANIPVQLSSEKAYVTLTKIAITSALGYTPATFDSTKYWQEITYANLVSLRDNNNLVPGRFYRINDYETIVGNQFDGYSDQIGFDIIVQALSTNELSEDAHACLNANDVYFSTAGSNLEGWKLKYCLDNDISRFDWANEENGKGVIYRMIDEYGNSCPFDFKNIRWSDDTYFFTCNVDDTYFDASLQNFGDYFNCYVINNTLEYSMGGEGSSSMALPKSSIIIQSGGSICKNTFNTLFQTTFNVEWMDDNNFGNVVSSSFYDGYVSHNTCNDIYNSTFDGCVYSCDLGIISNCEFSCTEMFNCTINSVGYSTFAADNSISYLNIDVLSYSSFTGAAIKSCRTNGYCYHITIETTGNINSLTFESGCAYLTCTGQTVNIAGPTISTAVVGSEASPIDLADILIRSSSGGFISRQTVYVTQGGDIIASYNAPYSYSTVDDTDQVPTTANVCYWPVSESSTLAFSGNLYNGMDVHIIVENVSDATVTIALPTEDPFVKTGTVSSLILAAGKCGEINALMINNKVFLRASL